MATNAQSADIDKIGWWQAISGCAAMMTATDRRNYTRFSAWLAVWGLLFIVATLLLDSGVLASSDALRWTVAIAPGAGGVGVLFAYLRFLRAADELMQRVQIEGLALGFGVGVLFSMGYRLLERAGAPSLDINDPVLLMLVAWFLGQMVALRRYQ
jgi:hypothetical protein